MRARCPAEGAISPEQKALGAIAGSGMQAATLDGRPRQRTKESTMLVLSRKKNESIVINDDITIVVVEIRGDKVRLGWKPPRKCPSIATKSTKRFAAISSRRQRPAARSRRQRRRVVSPRVVASRSLASTDFARSSRLRYLRRHVSARRAHCVDAALISQRCSSLADRRRSSP